MIVKTSKDAELNATEAMRSWGYLDADSPMRGADGGIDVFSSKALAQVKFREKKSGRPELQNLYGARAGQTDKALMFFDAKGYSSDAVVYANQHGIGLYVYDTSGAVWSVNSHGTRLMGVSIGTRLTTALRGAMRRPGVKVFGQIFLGVTFAAILIFLTIPGRS